MNGWYRVWWRFLSRIDGRHNVFLFRQHLFAWGKIGETCGARGGVMERRCTDENGEEIAEICVHKDLIFRDVKATDLAVFASDERDDVERVVCFWQQRAEDVGLPATMARMDKLLANEYVHVAFVAVELLCAFPLVTETGSLHA